MSLIVQGKQLEEIPYSCESISPQVFIRSLLLYYWRRRPTKRRRPLRVGCHCSDEDAPVHVSHTSTPWTGQLETEGFVFTEPTLVFAWSHTERVDGSSFVLYRIWFSANPGSHAHSVCLLCALRKVCPVAQAARRCRAAVASTEARLCRSVKVDGARMEFYLFWSCLSDYAQSPCDMDGRPQIPFNIRACFPFPPAVYPPQSNFSFQFDSDALCYSSAGNASYVCTYETVHTKRIDQSL